MSWTPFNETFTREMSLINDFEDDFRIREMPVVIHNFSESDAESDTHSPTLPYTWPPSDEINLAVMAHLENFASPSQSSQSESSPVNNQLGLLHIFLLVSSRI